MSARPDTSAGRRTKRIISAGSAVGALLAFGMAPLAVPALTQAYVIDDFLGGPDALGFVGSGTFDTLGAPPPTAVTPAMAVRPGMRAKAVVAD